MLFLKICVSITSLLFLILLIISVKLKRNFEVTIVPLFLFIANFILFLLIQFNIF
ncbi:hypothetical protein SAMN02744040_01896 [Tepidibacter thalassicus DSM 15285]|uniref:Uncharacterized protein n=1 Tax=Tepidibacter thalassicus DSM 15285 TaxID=1123350 RepID=A0A1M5STI7_9FIRM|nr:hypothetical protein SAMN02744040_01896 [Tepidibacter thalassicus DSM 15285]